MRLFKIDFRSFRSTLLALYIYISQIALSVKNIFYTIELTDLF